MTNTTDVAVLVEGSRLCCLAESKSPTTIRWYMGKLNVFHGYLQAQGFPADVCRLTTTHLRAFLAHLRENVKAGENNPRKPTEDRNLSPRTIQGYARALKVFFSWLAREGYTANNPSRLLSIPKAPKVIVETLSDAQIKRLFSVIDRRSSKGFRDYCILLVLLDTGVRLSELVNLQVRDLDLERGFFKVMGKGARERLVPFGARVQTARWKYMHRFRPEPFHPNLGNLFLKSSGMPPSCGQVYRRIRHFGRKAGVEDVRCSPHTFRHTFAKKFLVNGGDLFTLQKVLGHSSLAVVRMYVELTPEDVRIRHRQYSPVDWIKV